MQKNRLKRLILTITMIAAMAGNAVAQSSMTDEQII